MAYEASFRVWRGDAGAGSLQDYKVEVNEGEVVLDVLHRIQATQASDLALRWNCKAGKCGSCSMEINGRPRLGCMTRMSALIAARCSADCGIHPPSAATTNRTAGTGPRPASMFGTKRSWPGTSTNATVSPP